MANFGARKPTTVRLPTDHYDYYDALAAEESLDLGTWIIKELSEKNELPIPAFVGKHKRRRRTDDCPQPGQELERSVPDLDNRRRLNEEGRSKNPAA
jgi:hypothetical protein